MIPIVVYGVPAPQGSRAPYGGEANPRTRPWRAAVAAEAASAMEHLALSACGTVYTFARNPLLEGPLRIRAEFFFPRPKAHYTTKGLRPAAPEFHAVAPDADKLARAIGDALAGIVYRNDAQIAVWRIVKRYGEPARCELEIEHAT